MTAQDLEREIQQHEWRITALKAELFDELQAVAQLRTILDAMQAEAQQARR